MLLPNVFTLNITAFMQCLFWPHFSVS